LIDQLTIKVANELGQIRRVRDRVHAFGEQNGLPPDILYMVKLSIEELLTNTVSYGYSDQDAHTIEIQIDLKSDKLDVRITDDAAAFDPRDAKEPDTKAALKDREVGGLGIHLVKGLMDGIEYRRERGRNCLILTKHFGR